MKKSTKKYVPPHKFYEVIWLDAASNSETWVAVSEVTGPEEVITRGWLVKDVPEYVCLASSVSNEDLHNETVGNTLTIPRGMVKSMRELKLTTAKPRVKKAKAKPTPQPVQAVEGEADRKDGVS